jgi:hypothetical protein
VNIGMFVKVKSVHKESSLVNIASLNCLHLRAHPSGSLCSSIQDLGLCEV